MANREKVFRGDRLSHARKQREMSRPALARESGIGESQLYRYEAQGDEPTAAIVARLAQTLGVTTDYLLGVTDSELAEATPEETLSEVTLTDEEATILDAYRRGDFKEAMRLFARD